MTRKIDPELIARLRHVADSLEAMHQSYEESDENRMNTNTNRDTTSGQGSVQGEGTLTDEEREAIEWFAEVRKPLDSLDGGEYVATLRKLLGRTNSPQPFAAAYAVYLNGEYDSSYGPDAIDEAMEIAADCHGEIVPLYCSPTLTDEEREAISLAYSRLTADANYGEVAATLKALLERVRK